jgi:hypothetical protein
MSIKRVTATSVRLASGIIHPGDLVLINTGGYHGQTGKFHGLLHEGRLAVKVNCSKYSQTVLYLSKAEVERKAPS